jgi:hypothetical protein
LDSANSHSRARTSAASLSRPARISSRDGTSSATSTTHSSTVITLARAVNPIAFPFYTFRSPRSRSASATSCDGDRTLSRAIHSTVDCRSGFSCSTIRLYRHKHWLVLLNNRRLDVLLMIREDRTFDGKSIESFTD